MLQLHLSDQTSSCLLSAAYIKDFTVGSNKCLFGNMSPTQKDFNYLWYVNVDESWKMQISLILSKVRMRRGKIWLKYIHTAQFVLLQHVHPNSLPLENFPMHLVTFGTLPVLIISTIKIGQTDQPPLWSIYGRSAQVQTKEPLYKPGYAAVKPMI